MEFLDRSAETTELAKALLNVQRQMSPATRDGKNPFTKSSYATLNSVMESCRDALLNNNIWLCQYLVPVETPDCIGLMTKLTHTESGQWQSSLAVVPLPKADPQGMGSAITYSRRYSITAMLGMVTEDDDGEAAKINPRSVSRSKITGSRQKQDAQNKPLQPASAENALGPDTDEISELPQLEGITYQLVTAQDGRNCIIATGNTIAKNEILSGAGFRWNQQRKIWWKYSRSA